MRWPRRRVATAQRGALMRWLPATIRGAALNRWLCALIVGGTLACAFATTADARPGGGHSYSGGGGGRSYSGGSSSRSSGSGGGGDLGVGGFVAVVVIMVVVMLIAAAADKRDQTSWTSQVVRPASRIAFRSVVERDPGFSQAAFEDFAFELYARAQRARGKPKELEPLTPYLGLNVIAQLETASPVAAVVIGSLRVIEVSAKDEGHHLNVRIEANLANPTGTTKVIELWTFTRAAEVQTRGPDKTRTFPCPSCNAPFTRGASPQTCAHCGKSIHAGIFDWTVTNATVNASTTVGLTLTGTVQEVGTDLTTVVADDAFATIQSLYEADKNVTWDAFSAHVTMIYERLNAAWNSQDLTPVRGLVTGSLLGYLQFWIDEYKRQRLANKLERAKISRIALAKVLRDPYYDAVTVRVFADGHDFTLDAEGNVVGGSKTSRRAYTEYWTFLRSSTRRGPVTTEPKCPNCGAPLAISNLGECTHCSAVVETGNFDFVLSKIEQDEVYAG